MNLEQNIAQLLTRRQKSLSVAESCSGGLLSDRLTNVPGSSKFFKGGVIAYSNTLKTQFLKVPINLIKKHGSVSAPVAEKMAQNVRRILKTDFGVSITGIAGPSGGTKAKPVGLTFISVSDKNKIVCRKYILKGTRTSIKSQATTAALKILLRLL